MPHTKAAGEDASTGERDRCKRTAARNAARFLAHLVAEAWPERPRGEVRAPSDGEPVPGRETGSAAVVASGSVAEGAGPAVGGVMVSPVTGQTAPAHWEPAHANEEIGALSQRLQAAHGRRKRLLEAGAATDAVDREILERKRQLREGGRLRAGDSVGDGRYVLVEELGRGGFAIVWKAKDEVEKRHVAIKVLHANLAGDAIRRERFYRGARAMRRLQHPGVVRVLDPEGEDGGFCYFVMELVPNGNLHDAVVRRSVPEGEVLAHILRVGEALAEAHAQGMIHRDIKPQNILLDEGFEAKLTDFDLVGTKDTTGGTRTGAMGTFIYAAPECLEKPQEATARVDVYGLGMTAIFCLTGKALTRSTLRDPEPTIAGLDCLPAVKEVLRRAVAWEPEARYVDAGEIVSALQAAMSTDLGEKVINGEAGSGAEAGGAVPIALGIPVPMTPDVPSTGALPVESQVSGRGSQPGDFPVFGSSAVKAVLRRAVTWKPEERYADAAAMVSALRATIRADLAARVVNGDGGSGTETGDAVPPHVVSATPSAISIVSPLPAVPIAPDASVPLTPDAPAAGGLPLQPQVSAGRSQQEGLPVFGDGGFYESVMTVPVQSRPNKNKLMYALIGSVGLLVVAAVVVVLLKSKHSSDDDRSAIQVASAMDRARAIPDKEPSGTAGTLAQAKPANTVTESKPSDLTPPNTPPSQPAHGADLKKSTDDYATKPLAKSPGDANGYAVISSRPLAQILIDGKNTGLSTPISGHTLPLTPGKHSVTFVVDGHPFTVAIAVKAGEAVLLHKDLGALGAPPPKREPPPTPAPLPTPQEIKGGCDEFSCVLTSYDGVCCAKFKKGGARSASSKGDVPAEFDDAVINDGLAKVKANIARCVHKVSGSVEVLVTVSPNGGVISVKVESTPDGDLGDCVEDVMKKATFARTRDGGSFSCTFMLTL
jgi:serine/threonine protein kinase/outer membrane biosynthesis protein TonB